MFKNKTESVATISAWIRGCYIEFDEITGKSSNYLIPLFKECIKTQSHSSSTSLLHCL